MNWKSILFASTLILFVPSTSPALSPELPTLPGTPALPELPGIPEAAKMQVVPPTPADAITTYTLLTVMVAEGANIWLPSTLILKNTESVALALRNVSKVDHGFAIDALGIKEIIPAGETKMVVVTPGGSGPLRYYCPLHKGHVGGQLLIQ